MEVVRLPAVGGLVISWLVVFAVDVSADGTVKGPAEYEGSLEEKSQEAIIVFNPPGRSTGAVEDLILKITVEGDVDQFAWVIPFPNEPAVDQADAKLFSELFDYVESRLHPAKKKLKSKKGGGFGGGGGEVEVLSRQLVGSYDVAVVRENVGGTLNQWLDEEGYQRIENGEEIIEFYRQREFVFCCIKVSEAQPESDETASLHPLRFTFDTGGRDGIYFPMKLTGLQEEEFDVNLYVFSLGLLDADHRKYGYEQRGFYSKYREKKKFPIHSVQAPTFSAFLSELHPRRRFYLTKLQSRGVEPADIRSWENDLWIFPRYRTRRFVPYDARRGGPAYIE